MAVNSLPSEILSEITAYLEDSQDLCNLSCVNKAISLFAEPHLYRIVNLFGFRDGSSESIRKSLSFARSMSKQPRRRWHVHQLTVEIDLCTPGLAAEFFTALPQLQALHILQLDFSEETEDMLEKCSWTREFEEGVSYLLRFLAFPSSDANTFTIHDLTRLRHFQLNILYVYDDRQPFGAFLRESILSVFQHKTLRSVSLVNIIDEFSSVTSPFSVHPHTSSISSLSLEDCCLSPALLSSMLSTFRGLISLRQFIDPEGLEDNQDSFGAIWPVQKSLKFLSARINSLWANPSAFHSLQMVKHLELVATAFPDVLWANHDTHQIFSSAMPPGLEVLTLVHFLRLDYTETIGFLNCLSGNLVDHGLLELNELALVESLEMPLEPDDQGVYAKAWLLARGVDSACGFAVVQRRLVFEHIGRLLVQAGVKFSVREYLNDPVNNLFDDDQDMELRHWIYIPADGNGAQILEGREQEIQGGL